MLALGLWPRRSEKVPHVASTKPPPPTTSSTPYVIGVIVLLLLAFGLYRWKASTTENTTPQIATVVASATQNDVPVLNAPPPPPKIEEVEDAGVDAGSTAPKAATGGGNGGCGGKCDNPASPALQ